MLTVELAYKSITEIKKKDLQNLWKLNNIPLKTTNVSKKIFQGKLENIKNYTI